MPISKVLGLRADANYTLVLRDDDSGVEVQAKVGAFDAQDITRALMRALLDLLKNVGVSDDGPKEGS